MDAVKRKVLLDLFGSPSTVVPIVGGLSAWMLSWGMDGNMWLNLAGLAAVLGGVGLTVSRLIFGLEEITEDAYNYLNEQERQEREAALDALSERLRGDQDPRTQTYLRDLRELYSRLDQSAREGEVPGAAHPVLEKVEQLFQAAVKHLEHSYHLWETANRTSGAAKRSLLREREQVLEEVRQTTEHLGRTVEQFQAFRTRESEAELAKLREELDETMQVARRAEERVAALGDEKKYDHSEFE